MARIERVGGAKGMQCGVLDSSDASASLRP